MCLLSRARVKELWDAAAQEVDAVAPRGPVRHEELAHMPYLEACLKVIAFADCVWHDIIALHEVAASPS